MPRRERPSININDVFTSVNLDGGLRAGLLGLDHDELAALLADIAQSADLPIFKRPKTLPSFSTAKWPMVAQKLGLPSNPANVQFDSFGTPSYLLPLSLHETMFENSWRWQDVYREKGDQEREEARMRLLEPYIVPILALFQGRVIDEPEQAIAGTEYSSGGYVEHKIIMIGGILFFVIEFKLGTPKEDHLAQLFLELLSITEQNNLLDFSGLHVYGLLTDLNQFKFYSYDSITQQFCSDKVILIDNKRIHAFSDMILVSNKIFGLVLFAYMEGLQAIIVRSKNREKQGDFYSKTSAPRKWGDQSTSSQKGKKNLNTSGHRSANQWEAALSWAQACVDKFNEPVQTVEDIERVGNDALKLLTKSVFSIPHASLFSGGINNPSTPAALKELAIAVVKKGYEDYLSQRMD